MASHSAGILLYRLTEGGLTVLLVHPGGPFWANRDRNAWTIPKGSIEKGETPEAAALREFEEETGSAAGGELAPWATSSRPEASGSPPSHAKATSTPPPREQSFRARMAAEERTKILLPGDRPGRMVHSCRGTE